MTVTTSKHEPGLDPDSLVRQSDIAVMAGVGRSCVSNWINRHDSFPSAVGRTSRGPVWRRGDVAEWLDRRGHERPTHRVVNGAIVPIDEPVTTSEEGAV